MTLHAMAGLTRMVKAVFDVWRTLDPPVQEELREWAEHHVPPRWRAVFRAVARAL